jgi:cytochrome c-type biogenesis protein CcmH/NrfG
MALDRKTALKVGVIAVLAIAVSVALLYAKLGSRSGGEAPAHPATMPGAAPATSAESPMTGKASLSLDQAADRLAKRLQQQDGSADDWTLLGRSYVEMRRYPEAVSAFEAAQKKSPNDAKLREELERAKLAAAGGSPAPR